MICSTGPQHPKLLRHGQRVLQRQALLAVQQQPGAELGQRRRVEPAVIDRQAQGDLPAQIPRDVLHRLLIRAARPVLHQQHLGQQRRRDRRPAAIGRVAVGEVLVAHDPIAVLGQQREERPLRQRPHQLRRIEEPHLRRRRRQHDRRVLNPPDGTAVFQGSPRDVTPTDCRRSRMDGCSAQAAAGASRTRSRSRGRPAVPSIGPAEARGERAGRASAPRLAAPRIVARDGNRTTRAFHV